MARDEIKYDVLEARVRAMVEDRARVALDIYTREPLAYDDPMYPFEPHDQQSIRDAESQSVTSTPRGVRIAVESPGARFIETGNRPGGVGATIKPRTKPSLIIALRGGGVYATSEVRAHGGTNRLLNAVRRAFGLPL